MEEEGKEGDTEEGGGEEGNESSVGLDDREVISSSEDEGLCSSHCTCMKHHKIETINKNLSGFD